MDSTKFWLLNFVPYEWWPMSGLFLLQTKLLETMSELDKEIKSDPSNYRSIHSKRYETNKMLSAVEGEINKRLIDRI